MNPTCTAPAAVVTNERDGYVSPDGRLTIRFADVAFNGHAWTQTLLSFSNKHPGAIAVATRPDGSVLLIQTWRQAVGRMVWELPRGGGQDPDPVVTATNELIEETGYAPTGPGRFLGWSDKDSAFITDQVGYVAFDIAADAVPGETDLEAFDVAWFTRTEVARMLVSGEITCAMTVTGLGLLDAHALAAAADAA